MNKQTLKVFDPRDDIQKRLGHVSVEMFMGTYEVDVSIVDRTCLLTIFKGT